MSIPQQRVLEAWAEFVALVVEHDKGCNCGRVEIRRPKGHPTHIFVNDRPGGIFQAEFVTFDPVAFQVLYYVCQSWNYPSLSFQPLVESEALGVLESLREKIASFHKVTA